MIDKLREIPQISAFKVSQPNSECLMLEKLVLKLVLITLKNHKLSWKCSE